MKGHCRWGIGFCLFLGWAVMLEAANVNALLEAGKKRFSEGDFNRALQTFLAVKKEDPANSTAREYIRRCQEKIVAAQKELKLKESLRLEKAAVATISPQEEAPAWTSAPSSNKKAKTSPFSRPKNARRKKNTPPSFEAPKSTSRFVITREILAEGYQNKTLEDHAVKLVRKGGKVEIVAYLSRLFLPFSDALAPDSVPTVESVCEELRKNPGRTVLLRAVDSLTPAIRHQMLDLPARRVSILFTYFVHASTNNRTERQDRATLSAQDLDD